MRYRRRRRARKRGSILIEGIRRLEYRGYDSTGLAVINGGMHRLVSTARVADLAAQAAATNVAGTTGISHTRWATHGAPTPTNAHPHLSNNEIAVVHNGIIENFEVLRERLQAKGYRFVTQTDTEVIVHLIHAHYVDDLLDAVRKAAAEFHGAYAIAAITTREPGRIVGARAGSPLLVGVGEHDHFLASDASALSPVTRRVVYLEEGDVADITRNGYAIYDAQGVAVSRPIVTVEASGDAVELGPYRHFMQKEIFEQPRAIADTLDSVEGIVPELFGDNAAEILSKVDAVQIRVRHELLLGHGRTLVARGNCRHSGAGRSCQRVPLSHKCDQSQRAGGRHFAIGRNRRHVGGIEARAIAGRQTDAGHLQCGHQLDGAADQAHLPDAGRRGDRCRIHQGIHHPTHGAVPAHAGAGQASWSPERRAGGHMAARIRHLPAAIQAVLALEPQIIAWADVSRKRRTRFFSAAGCTIRSRWKARLSSRKSLTFMARRIPLANSSTARWRWSMRTCPSWRLRQMMRYWRN